MLGYIKPLATISYSNIKLTISKENIQLNDLIDVVYEVIDARMPKSSKIKDIDDLLKDKPRILIMTKKDLCDMNVTKKWIKYYEDEGYHVIAVDLSQNNSVNEIHL